MKFRILFALAVACGCFLSPATASAGPICDRIQERREARQEARQSHGCQSHKPAPATVAPPVSQSIYAPPGCLAGSCQVPMAAGFALPSSAGSSCAGGNCAAPSAPQRGFFRR